MSCYLIRVENGHKVARSITSEEEYRKIRGSYEQKANLRLAREGNDGAKRRLVQFNYSGHYPQGVVKGTKLPSQAFGFDLDDKQDFEKAAKLMLQEPEKYGLLMLKICSIYRPNSSRMIMRKLPWQLKARCWKSERSMDRRSCLLGRIRRISITSLGWRMWKRKL